MSFKKSEEISSTRSWTNKIDADSRDLRNG